MVVCCLATFLVRFLANTFTYVFNFYQMSETCLSTDRRVLAKMEDLVKTGVRRVQEMQRHVRQFVVDDLFAGQDAPSMSDARYWPSYKAVLNCIYRTVNKERCV